MKCQKFNTTIPDNAKYCSEPEKDTNWNRCLMPWRNASLTFVIIWVLVAVTSCTTLSSANVKKYHVWEKIEIVLFAQSKYENPYTDVMVWVDLKGPGFTKRCYGFWDGGDTFRVRVMATAPGTWTWKSGSKPADPGLEEVSGSFMAVDWTESSLATRSH